LTTLLFAASLMISNLGEGLATGVVSLRLPQRRGTVDPEYLRQIVDRARENPEFFHSLVFDPEKAIAETPGPELDRFAKAKLLAINPETVITSLLRAEAGCKDPTCGPQSCLDTCGPHSCDWTCKSSCIGSTCGAFSCGGTTEIFRGELGLQ
jgi:hypothetical protein